MSAEADRRRTRLKQEVPIDRFINHQNESNVCHSFIGFGRAILGASLNLDLSTFAIDRRLNYQNNKVSKLQPIEDNK